MKRTILAAACLIGTIGAMHGAIAQETGFHSMHALKKVGGKLCMVDHTHAGKSPQSGTGSKAVAVKLAINNWVSFTEFEYGKSWGKWSNAWAKAEKCSGGGGNWVCEVTARPCKGR